MSYVRARAQILQRIVEPQLVGKKDREVSKHDTTKRKMVQSESDAEKNTMTIDQKSTDYGLWTKSGPLPIFAQSVK